MPLSLLRTYITFTTTRLSKQSVTFFLKSIPESLPACLPDSGAGAGVESSTGLVRGLRLSLGRSRGGSLSLSGPSRFLSNELKHKEKQL